MISGKESCEVESHYSFSKTIHKNKNNCTRKTHFTPSLQVSRLENNEIHRKSYFLDKFSPCSLIRHLPAFLLIPSNFLSKEVIFCQEKFHTVCNQMLLTRMRPTLLHLHTSGKNSVWVFWAKNPSPAATIQVQKWKIKNHWSGSLLLFQFLLQIWKTPQHKTTVTSLPV